MTGRAHNGNCLVASHRRVSGHHVQSRRPSFRHILIGDSPIPLILLLLSGQLLLRIGPPWVTPLRGE